MGGEAEVLQKLLEVIAKGGVHIYGDLARELEVSQELVEAMVADLARQGYLQLALSDCPSRCPTRPLARTCAVGEPGRVWVWAPLPDRQPRNHGVCDLARKVLAEQLDQRTKLLIQPDQETHDRP